MSFVQLLLFFRSLPITDLLNYPDDLNDVRGVRRWLSAVCETGGALASLTDTTIDDAVIDALVSVVDDEETFNVLYSIVLNIFEQEDDFDQEYTNLYSDAVRAGNKVGLAPALIIAIVQLIVMILKFIRERRA